MKTFPLWLLSGLLYGLSWPIFEEVNLSFLAWFAFVPLFILLEKQQHSFWKSISASYGAMVVFGCFSAGWLFNFPQSKIEIALIFFLEELWFFMPFLLFFFVQKKVGFNKALWLLPFIWMLWEWTYLNLEFTMGTHLSPYSQSNNLWLIQFIDITGMWGLSFWIMLFNVSLFKALQAVEFNFRSIQLYKRIGIIFGFMLGIPSLYSAFAFSNYGNLSGESIKVSLIPTQFSADYSENLDHQISIVEQTLHRTDSLAFFLMDRNKSSDLYIWPESGTNYWLGYSNLSAVLSEATQDWGGALITGCKGITDGVTEEDKRTYVSGVLISPQQKEPSYHHKTALTPGQEAIPYHSFFAQLPFFSIEENDPNYYKRGQESKPLALITRKKKTFQLGVSLCFEQWYPSHWTTLAENGADFYVHMAGEGWYGHVGFMNFMANVTRMRCIENRHQAARCANVGLSLFINQMGEFHQVSKKGTLDFSTSKLYSSNIMTTYAKYPNWFPVFGFLIFLGLVPSMIIKHNQSSIK